MLTVAIQYPSFGPQHPPRLRAIVKAAPFPDARVVAMEMFVKDSDYEWVPVETSDEPFERYTVMDCESAAGRRSPRTLRAAVFGALDEIRPDVLVVNGWGHRESRASLAWARRHRCRVVLLSDSTYEDSRRVWYKELCKRWVLRGCKAAFVAGSPQARYAERLGIPRDRVFHPGSCVVDNGYWRRESARARQHAADLRREFSLPERYFLCVARFVQKKNVPFLVRAYTAYRRRAGAGALGLVLCGTGPEEGPVRATMDRMGLCGDVCLAGFQQADTLPAYYGLASCFILPSMHWEQWGLVVNEAMACGLPVLVSSRCGCAEDLVRDGVNGYAFDPKDEEALAGLMVRMTGDEEKLAAMGRESERIIAGHSCEVGAENLWKAVKAATDG